jgi:predicted RNase H-like nuclease (RuvC/YqgF family)
MNHEINERAAIIPLAEFEDLLKYRNIVLEGDYVHIRSNYGDGYFMSVTNAVKEMAERIEKQDKKIETLEHNLDAVRTNAERPYKRDVENLNFELDKERATNKELRGEIDRLNSKSIWQFIKSKLL